MKQAWLFVNFQIKPWQQKVFPAHEQSVRMIVLPGSLRVIKLVKNFVFVIGKSLIPRAFRAARITINNFPVNEKANKKS